MIRESVSLLQGVEAYVNGLFREHRAGVLPYHSLIHTWEVVGAAGQLTTHYHLEQTQGLIVGVAAWFHDVGYLTGPAEGHEERSLEMATAFLEENQVPPAIVAQVQGCIRATQLPHSPRNLLEEIVCDADMFHLGSATFGVQNKLLRLEKEYLAGREISGGEWRKENIRFLKAHHYFTGFARLLLNETKYKHLLGFQEKQLEKEGQQAAAGKLERGVETMFRTTSANHIKLSDMADSKANIMITVNAILVSVIVSLLGRRVGDSRYLILPVLLFLTTAVVTIIFSVLATRPDVTEGTFTKEDIEQKNVNLLFFGNFFNMKLTDYKWGINELMKDHAFLYGSMAEDIYSIGVVVARKYKLLRVAYNVFMVGFVLSVLAFSVAITLFG